MREWRTVDTVAAVLIQQLLSGYVSCVDDGRIDDVTRLFAPDGALTAHGGRTLRGHKEIGGYLRRSYALRESAGGPLRHHTTPCAILSIDDSSATVHSYFCVLGPTGVDHWGIYRDRVVLDEQDWCFAERAVSLEGMDPDGWIGTGKGPVAFNPPTRSQEIGTPKGGWR